MQEMTSTHGNFLCTLREILAALLLMSSAMGKSELGKKDDFFTYVKRLLVTVKSEPHSFRYVAPLFNGLMGVATKQSGSVCMVMSYIV